MKTIPTIFTSIVLIIIITIIVFPFIKNTEPQNNPTTNNTPTKEETDITLCQNTGGTWNECGSGCGPLTKQQEENNKLYNTTLERRICPAVCIPQCTCPQEKKYWDETKGCEE